MRRLAWADFLFVQLQGHRGAVTWRLRMGSTLDSPNYLKTVTVSSGTCSMSCATEQPK